MKVYIVTIEDTENTTVVGAYSDINLAHDRIEQEMEERETMNLNLGVNPHIIQVELDDVDSENYA
jgi:hypothetical protein